MELWTLLAALFMTTTSIIPVALTTRHGLESNHFCGLNSANKRKLMNSPCGTLSGTLEDIEDCIVNSFDLCTETARMRLSMENQLRNMRNQYFSKLFDAEVSLLQFVNTNLPLEATTNVSKVTEHMQHYFLELSCLGHAMNRRFLYREDNDEIVLCDVMNDLKQALCVLNTAARGNVDSTFSHRKLTCQDWKGIDSSKADLLFVKILSDFLEYLVSLKWRCTHLYTDEDYDL